ncbi:putative calcium-binding protein At1g02270 [Bidens hawaiensis]|uniref:putative calcium-binding protein At1g02270 n=1 Tax=Bidens hawaiensis TaxID=980011 RepID=UPI00404A91B8
MAKKRGVCSNYNNSFSCTTFNILAPIYKRLIHEDHACRESEIRGYWFNRNQGILDLLLRERSSIICLQEFWVGNEELVNMYDTRLRDAGYLNFKLARTNNRGDGLLTAVHKDYFRVIDHREFLFNGFGDRVALLLHVQLLVGGQQVLIVNTHLLFPHDSSMCLERLRQVYKILQSVEAYQKENNLSPLPIILCGDWNGSKRGHVYKFLRSQGFVSSYDTAHHYTDADAHKWVSHRNHRGNICGVDFIWLLNPNKCRKVLKTSWSDAVFRLFKYHVRRASLTEEDAFALLKANSDGNGITYSGFCEALHQLNFIGHPNGLSDEETKDLWVQADIDGNGVIDYKEFQQQIWNPPTRCEQTVTEEDLIGYRVKNAVLYPSEAEKGMWPDDYSLSDHARLTVVFSPAVRMRLA